jgi:hypothetical protein
MLDTVSVRSSSHPIFLRPIPVVDSFRTLCFSPPAGIKQILLEMQANGLEMHLGDI